MSRLHFRLMQRRTRPVLAISQNGKFGDNLPKLPSVLHKACDKVFQLRVVVPDHGVL